MRGVFAYYLSLLALQACQEDSRPVDPNLIVNTPRDLTVFIPETMKLDEGCVWKIKKLEVFQNPKGIVSFRYADCGFDEAVKFNVSNNGTRIEKAFYDVIYESIHIFERTNQPLSEFIENLPVDIFVPEEHCESKQVADNLWIFDDGLAIDDEINRIPCGRYGRNFSGQTVFEVKDNIVLNYNILRNKDGIDPSSIVLLRQPSP